ncbi:MAG: hypothetical protein G01um101419_532 [Parcubacteria group bacterium Gr01-1014_19]|nr:MAG: hypothetical protein G01um101419_532 [Parcubacteria group bacterium Gr01-1014_19]
MQKFAILALVAVMAFGSLGCQTLGGKWGLPNSDQAKVVNGLMGYSTRADGCSEFYVVVLEYKGHQANVRVSKETFEAVNDGDAADIELMAVLYSGKIILATFYLWKVGGKAYEVKFVYVEEKE